MSLVGNLEDLALGDILQIVSLSRKSGVLALKSRGRNGEIVFQEGQVIRAVSSVYSENLGEFLLKRKLVPLESLKQALRVQQAQDRPRRLGRILAEDFGVSPEAIEKVIREQVEKVVYSFFGWTEGTFSFELGEPEDLADTSLNPLQFMLAQGISPQWLAMEGSRLLDERRRREEGDLPVEPSTGRGGPGAGPPGAEAGLASDSETPQPPSAMFNLGAELLAELGEGPQSTGIAEGYPGLHLLKGMLQELSNPSLGGGIILLVLRFASEFMNRAVIFALRAEEIVGLGQFGIEPPGGNADSQVRSIRIPAGEPSLFSPVLETMASCKLHPQDRPWDRYLADNLGGKRPKEVFLGPILSEGKIVAILYGDNVPADQPIGDTEPLEIFLSQAGLAMEKALLERRLRGKSVV